MKPLIAVFDDFFQDPAGVQSAIFAGKFDDVQSPIDGVTYPGINREIPADIQHEVLRRLTGILGVSINPVVLFARATTKNTPPAPHRIHSDKIMSDFSCHIYLSNDWPGSSGTSFWTHKTEGVRHTKDTNIARIIEDANNPEAWSHTLTCQGKFNRILIHDACYWHCAEPVGGWGEGIHDGRVVLTCFFNVFEKELWL